MSSDPPLADLRSLWLHAARQFELGPHTPHGPDHWQRVEANGLEVARHSGADVRVVRLFAVLHDARRLTDGADVGHGRRAADLAAELRGRLFDLDDAAFALLYDACAGHELGGVSLNSTIGTCWDADRLDLPRVGLRPLLRFMSTEHGKRLAGRGRGAWR
jgi:uncharacterized protein